MKKKERYACICVFIMYVPLDNDKGVWTAHNHHHHPQSSENLPSWNAGWGFGRQPDDALESCDHCRFPSSQMKVFAFECAFCLANTPAGSRRRIRTRIVFCIKRGWGKRKNPTISIAVLGGQSWCLGWKLRVEEWGLK